MISIRKLDVVDAKIEKTSYINKRYRRKKQKQADHRLVSINSINVSKSTWNPQDIYVFNALNPSPSPSSDILTILLRLVATSAKENNPFTSIRLRNANKL